MKNLDIPEIYLSMLCEKEQMYPLMLSRIIDMLEFM